MANNLSSADGKGGAGFLALFFGALLLLFNVAAVMMMDSAKGPDGKFPFNTASAVVVSEFVKFCIASVGFLKAVRTNPNVKYTLQPSSFLKYSVPGLLYAFCNVGNYEVLRYLSSSLFQIFNNMKIITTAVVYRSFLKRKLTVIQWVCLCFLTLGMVLSAPPKSGGGGSGSSGGAADSASALVTGMVMMAVMSCASSMAGVYNEFLLKDSEDDAFFQSMQLYFWGVLICMVQFFHSAPEDQSFFHGYTTRTYLIIFLNAMYGQVVALTFKYADNIVKVYANSLASLVTAFLAYIFFNTPLYFNLLLGSIIVGCSVIMYYMDHTKLLQKDSEAFGGCFPRASRVCMVGAVVLMLLVGSRQSAANFRSSAHRSAVTAPSPPATTAKSPDPILQYLEKYDQQKLSGLVKRLKYGCGHYLDVFHKGFDQQVELITTFFNDHKLPFVYSDGSAVAIERFGMLSSPWDDDIDMCMMMDEGISIFTMVERKLHPAYVDITETKNGTAAKAHFCGHKAHVKACVGFRMFLLAGMNDCISFEALNWGFIQARYHPNCARGGSKVFDVWLNYKCRDGASKTCTNAQLAFKSYINSVKGLPKGKRTSNGLLREGMDMTTGETKVVTLRNGLKAPVLVKNQEYLNTIYTESWRDKAIVCPHNEFNSFGNCLEQAKYWGMRDILTTMQNIKTCRIAMGGE
jgi:UDP-sugar transporter A1/2/3